MKPHASFAFVIAVLALLISVGAAAGRLDTVRAEAEAVPGSDFTYQGRVAGQRELRFPVRAL